MSKLYLDELARILNPMARELPPEAGAVGFTRAQVRGVDKAKRTVTALVSTANVDRYEEVISSEAWDKDTIAAFMRNPVLIAGHTYSTPGGEPTVLGKWLSLRLTQEGLEGTCQFLPPGDALADAWWSRFEFGACRAFSIGFLTKAWEMRDFPSSDHPGMTKRLRVFTAIELLEISAVAIPANRESLVKTLSALDALDPAPGIPGNPGSNGGDEALSNRQLNARIQRAIGPAIQGAIKQLVDSDELQAMLEEVSRKTVLSLLLELREKGNIEAMIGVKSTCNHQELGLDDEGASQDPYEIFELFDETGARIGPGGSTKTARSCSPARSTQTDDEQSRAAEELRLALASAGA